MSKRIRAKYDKDLANSYKMEFRKAVKRLCLGVYCQGKRYFLSMHGHRICPRCKEATKGFEDVSDSVPMISKYTKTLFQK